LTNMFHTFSQYQEQDFYAKINDILAQVKKLDDKIYGLRYTIKTVKDVAFRKTLLAKLEGLEIERATLLKERDTLNALYHRKIDEEKPKAPEERKTVEEMKTEVLQEAEQITVNLTEPEVEQVMAVKVDPVLKQIEPEILEIIESRPDVETVNRVAELLTEKTLEKVVAEIEQNKEERPPEEGGAYALPIVPETPRVLEVVGEVEAGFSIGKLALVGLAIASLFTVFGKKKR